MQSRLISRMYSKAEGSPDGNNVRNYAAAPRYRQKVMASIAPIIR